MELFDLLTLSLAGLFVVIDVLALTYYWQLKEYRYDRMLDFLRYDDGRYKLFSPSNIFIVGLLLIAAGIEGSFKSPYSPYLLLSFIIGALVIRALSIKQVGLKRPQFTAKASGIVLVTLLINFGLFFLVETTYLLPLILLGQFIIVSLLALALTIPTKIAKGYYIKKATFKIQNRTDLTSIGITGSYGKSSTKEFVAQLLSSKHKVLKTPRNTNTEIGVARLILNQLQKTHEFFVAEMGAYIGGEIKTLAQIVQPQIGIITAVNSQHISLFGSIENIRKTKAELVQNLKPNGIAILNGDDANCRTIGETLDKKTTVHYYSMQADADVSCKLIDNSTIQILDQTLQLNIKLPAPFLVQNLLPALLTAHLSGMTIAELELALPKLNLSGNTIQTYKTKQGITVIDDSYNANPTGFKAAINYLLQQPGNKFIVTLGMLELGKESYQAHKEVAELIIKNNIHCFVTRHTAFRHFVKATQELKAEPLKHFTYIENLKLVKPTVLKQVKKGDTILLENKVPHALKAALKPVKS